MEADKSVTTIMSVLEYVNYMLRYLGAGFFTIMFMKALNFDVTKSGSFNVGGSGTELFMVSIVVGFFLYALHRSLLDRCYHKISTMEYLIRNKGILPDTICAEDIKMAKLIIDKFKLLQKRPRFMWTHFVFRSSGFDRAKVTDDFVTEMNNLEGRKLVNTLTDYVVFQIYSEGMLREVASKKPHLGFYKVLADGLDKRYAILAFLYCCCYGMILSAFMVFIHHWYHKTFVEGPCLHFDAIVQKCLIALILGLVIQKLFCSRFSYRLLRREMWIMDKYPQRQHIKKEHEE